MTATLNVVTKKKQPSEESAEQRAATELVRAVRFQLPHVFGDLELRSIGPQDVRAWHVGLVALV